MGAIVARLDDGKAQAHVPISFLDKKFKPADRLQSEPKRGELKRQYGLCDIYFCSACGERVDDFKGRKSGASWARASATPVSSTR